LTATGLCIPVLLDENGTKATHSTKVVHYLFDYFGGVRDVAATRCNGLEKEVNPSFLNLVHRLLLLRLLAEPARLLGLGDAGEALCGEVTLAVLNAIAEVVFVPWELFSADRASLVFHGGTYANSPWG